MQACIEGNAAPSSVADVLERLMYAVLVWFRSQTLRL